MEDDKSIHSAFSLHYHANKQLYPDLYSESAAAETAGVEPAASIIDNPYETVTLKESHPDTLLIETMNGDEDIGVTCANVEESHIILAIHQYNCSLGLAFYDELEDHVHLLAQDLSCKEESIAAMISIIAAQFDSVKLVLLNSKASEGLFDAIMGAFETSQIENLPSTAFNSQSVKHNLQTSLKRSLIDEQLCWDTDNSCNISIGCVGALLLKIPHPDKISADIALDSQMMITEDCLNSLHIFRKDNHPSLMQSGSKDGLSLFSLLNNTCTPMGSRLLSAWMRKPLTSPIQINKRLDTIETLLKHIYQFKEIQTILKKCKSLHFMNKTHKWTAIEWKCIYNTFSSASNLVGLVDELFSEELNELEPNCFFKIKSLFTMEFASLGNDIAQIIDFDSSNFEGRVVVNYGVDPDLDEWKRQYDNLDMFLSRVAHELKPTVSPLFQEELRVVYFPQLGFLLALPNSLVEQNSADLMDGEYQIKFVTEGTAFLKNSIMDELDETIGDIYHIIVDKEIEILYALQCKVAEYKSPIIEISQTIAEIDVIVSLAVTSSAYSYVRPTITDSLNVNIIEGRHPLLEHVTDIISNDTSFDADYKIIALTGPNASGKSIYLKQVGIIVFMAQIGCFVPAKQAEIGVFDAIFTRISARQSLENNASSFLLDLRQMFVASKYATEKSLVLMDEFGKGTNIADGVGLLSGILDFFASSDDCPRVIMTTHYHDLLQDEYLTERTRKLLTFKQMQILADDDSSSNKIVFLYKVINGICQNSLGIYCAKLAGVSQDLLDRAQLISEKIMKREPIEPSSKLITSNSDDIMKMQSIVDEFLNIEPTPDNIRKFLTDLNI